MIFDPSQLNVGNIKIHTLPNGGAAVLDEHDKLAAYNKAGEPDGNDWSWVRKDCKKG